MTLYMWFAAVGTLIYIGTAFIVAISGVNVPVGAAIESNRSPAVILPVESTRRFADDEQLFQELGCIQPNGEPQ